MTSLIQVIDPENTPLCVERIFVDEKGELRARISGVDCQLGARSPLAEAGVVVLQPLNAALARQRSVFNQLKLLSQADQFWCLAADQRLVNAARRFNSLKSHGQSVAGQQIWPPTPQE